MAKRTYADRVVIGLTKALAAAVILGGLLIFLAKPDQPTAGAPIGPLNGANCLREIANFYEPIYFTVYGWVAIWFLEWMAYFGQLDETPFVDFYVRHLRLESAVNCYQLYTGDVTLNMTQGPRFFRSTFNAIATRRGLPTIDP